MEPGHPDLGSTSVLLIAEWPSPPGGEGQPADRATDLADNQQDNEEDVEEEEALLSHPLRLNNSSTLSGDLSLSQRLPAALDACGRSRSLRAPPRSA